MLELLGKLKRHISINLRAVTTAHNPNTLAGTILHLPKPSLSNYRWCCQSQKHSQPLSQTL